MATTPPAPGRFSITTGWRSDSPIFSATVRAVRSAIPPAPNGTTMRIGFDGYVSEAIANGAATTSTNVAAIAENVEHAAATALRNTPGMQSPSYLVEVSILAEVD